MASAWLILCDAHFIKIGHENTIFQRFSQRRKGIRDYNLADMNTFFSLQNHVSLKASNTFGIDAIADCVFRLEHIEELVHLHQLFLQAPDREFLFLGGGSNLVLPDQIHSLVVDVKLKGRRIVEQNAEHTIIAAAAGEVWHDFVQWSLDLGLGGLENLSLIPGTVGAAPIQNIGAYGREVKDFFHSATVYNVLTGDFQELDRDACVFAYRDSLFKRAASKHLLITEVRFALPKAWKPELSYGDVAQRLRDQGIVEPNPQQVSETICAIRQSKLPDPSVLGNAGSFFKNPIVSKELKDRILINHPNCVHYAASDGNFKLAAGWLIEAAGWKGRQVGLVGVYQKQALVLVNHGGASGLEVRQLANQIQEDVFKIFGVQLEVEPIFVE